LFVCFFWILLVVSSCVLQELRSFGHRLIEAVVIAKHFYRHQCNHVQNDGPSQNIFFDTTEEESCDMKKEEKMPVDKQNIVDNARDCILQLIGNTRTCFNMFLSTIG
jgi:hypothetical protein